MPIWKRSFTLEDITSLSADTAVSHLGIEFTEIGDDFLRGRAVLKRALLLIDSRHGPKDVDREIMDMLDRAAVSYRLVLTKADKIKATDLAAVRTATEAEARRRPAAYPEVIATSSEGGMGVAELRAAVLEAIG